MSTVSSATVGTVKPSGTGFLSGLDNIEMSDGFWERQAHGREAFNSVFTPLNVSLLLVLVTVLYYRFKPAADPSFPPGERPVVFQTFTPRTLLKYNGTKNVLNPDAKVYLAVKGKVHDVTAGKNFYGPGGPYENFAGRDATRGLACQSFDEEMLTKDLDGPLDDCADLNQDQLENLQGWVERFDEKYLVVGKLVAYTGDPW